MNIPKSSPLFEEGTSYKKTGIPWQVLIAFFTLNAEKYVGVYER